jgi:DNA (cytosine-5)-methyltransferase 1
VGRVIGIDFFSGCGGTSLGLKKAGIEVVRGIDIDSSCREVYEKNIRGADFLCADISTLKPEEALEGIKRRKNDLLLFSACAPCQPFSAHAKPSVDDSRRSLLLKFAKFVRYHEPEFLFIENVPGIQNVKGNSTFNKFKKILDKLGYQVKFDIVDAKDYGVPQTRKRLLLLASNIKGIDIDLPKPTHGADLRPYRTVRDSISSLPVLRHGMTHSKINGHRARGLSELNYKRMKLTPKNGGNRFSWPKEYWLECHKNRKGHGDVYGRMFWDRPAPTLTCKCTSATNGRYAHPSQNRSITPREAACLQTFPLSFKFYGEIDQVTRHVGNAVPPLLSKKVGKKILKLLGSQ